MIQYGIISAFVIIYLSVNIQNLHSGACFRFSVLQGNRVLEWSWIRKLFEDPNPTLMKSSAKQGTESEAISSTTTCFFPFMDPAWIIGQPWRVHPIHPHQWVHKRQAFVAPRSCLDFRPGRECSHRVVGEVQDIPVLGLCRIMFSIFFEFFFKHVSTTCNSFYPESPCFILFMRWPGTYRPLREDSLGTCNCSTVAGEVTCAVIATRWG